MHRCVGLVLWLTVGVVAPASAVAAQTADYPGGTTVEVQGTSFARGEGGSGGGGQVGGAQTSRSQGLAVTGADVAQLLVLGGVLVGGGALLVRRSRHNRSSEEAAGA